VEGDHNRAGVNGEAGGESLGGVAKEGGLVSSDTKAMMEGEGGRGGPFTQEATEGAFKSGKEREQESEMNPNPKKGPGRSRFLVPV